MQLESGVPRPDRGEWVRHGSEQPHRGLPTLAGARDRGSIRVTRRRTAHPTRWP